MDQRRPRQVHVPPAAIAAGAALAQRALARRPRTTASTTAGAVLAAASGALLAGAVLRFRRSGTTVDPTAPDRASALVTGGANALTRNPMYVAMAGALVAHAATRRSWLALGPVALFVGVMTRGQIAAEERALTDAFGHEYEQYLRDVPRWVDARSARALARLVAGSR